MTLRDYARVLVRRWWIIALVAGIAAVSAFVFSWVQTPMYEADAKLMYEPNIDVANPLTGASYDNPTTRIAEINGVVTVLGGPEMQQLGSELLEEELGGPPQAEYTVEGEVDSESGSSTTASIVSVWGRSSDAVVAQTAANTYSEAFIAWRVEKEKAAITDAIQALRDQMDGYKGAAKQSTEYLVLQQRLRDLQIRRATVTGNFRLAVPATLPDSPYEPRPLRSAVLGLAIGLFAGIGLAFLLEQFDTSIHGHQEVARILQRPVIGRVPKFGHGKGGDSAPGEARVVTLTDPDGHAAEAFRVLRSNLEFMSLDTHVRSIAVCSSEQGEGKSVTACNLAVSLALAGKQVILIDGDLRAPRVADYMGLSSQRGVTTVVTGRDRLEDALQRVDLTPAAEQDRSAVLGEPGVAGEGTTETIAASVSTAAAAGAAGDAELVVSEGAGEKVAGLREPPEFYPDAAGVGDTPGEPLDELVGGNGEGPRLYVLPRGPRAPNPGEVAASQRFADLIRECAERAETVIVDTPALLVVGDAGAIAGAVDGILYVVDPGKLKRPALEAAAERLTHLPAPVLGAVVVRQRGGRGYYASYDYEYRGGYATGDGQRSRSRSLVGRLKG